MVALTALPAAAAHVAAPAAPRRSQVAPLPVRRTRLRCCASASSSSLAPHCDFLRYRREPGASEASLQTSVVTLELLVPGGGAEPLRVDLVSAVHVGDASYYEALQERLCVPDRVLYELVASKPQQPPGADRWRPAAPSRRRRRIRNPVALAQQFIAAVLRLELQLELLDYSRDNWYHADLELQQFLTLQRERDESWLQLLWRALQAARGAADAKPAPADAAWKRLLQWTNDTLPLPFFFQLMARGALDSAEDRPLSRSPVVGSFLALDISSGLKLIMAEQLAGESVFSAESLRGTVLVAERNRRAVAEVREAISAGARHVAVVYGSAHMPDMEKQLEEGLGLRRVSTRWLDAWRVPLPRYESSEQRLQRNQAAALGAFSLLLATDLSLWEQLLRAAFGWLGEHLP